MFLNVKVYKSVNDRSFRHYIFLRFYVVNGIHISNSVHFLVVICFKKTLYIIALKIIFAFLKNAKRLNC